MNRFGPPVPGTIADAFVVTPSDTAEMDVEGLYVGVGGNLSVEMLSGVVVTFASVQSGSLLPIKVRKVRSTGTTASSILGLSN